MRPETVASMVYRLRRRRAVTGLRYDARLMTVESPQRSCPRCVASVAADARFCSTCGQALDRPDEAGR